MTASHTIQQHHRQCRGAQEAPAVHLQTHYLIPHLHLHLYFPSPPFKLPSYPRTPQLTPPLPPVKETPQVIRTLCSGTPAQQLAALDANFTHDASFRHTVCRVPSFGDVNVPLLGAVNSRWVIGCVYRWYKLLSPRIEVEIESVVPDQKTQRLYVSMAQTFSLFIIPF
ncbi:hypothetical protein VC83_01931 [Pseudogymnoascus destructans]|uniref:SigF-like NTF2-like domain-containing protein n=1 Tax=Pseudogymnoascus destructans TaxID=655981 RepID=A0A177AHB5_9PEZI|nr:uncharacterized protein VC83_01931 [Pseudogymnoascus destructans]OAF61458.1 hypothetical protein VC83_01931 [Pseudogymnoascus destructans]